MSYRDLLRSTKEYLNFCNKIGAIAHYECLAISFALRHERVAELLCSSKNFDGRSYSSIEPDISDNLFSEFGIVENLSKGYYSADADGVLCFTPSFPFELSPASSSCGNVYDLFLSFSMSCTDQISFVNQLPNRITALGSDQGILMKSVSFDMYDIYYFDQGSIYAASRKRGDHKQTERKLRIMHEYIHDLSWIRLVDPAYCG